MTPSGSETDVNLYGVISQGIEQGNLSKVSHEAAQKVSQCLDQIKSVKGVKSVRASGTSLWVESDSSLINHKIIAHLRSHGVLVSELNEETFVTKPSLMFKST